MPLRGSQNSEVRTQNSQRRIVRRMYSEVRTQNSQRRIVRRMYSEVLICKALKILSLVGYFHRAALALYYFFNNDKRLNYQGSKFCFFCLIPVG